MIKITTARARALVAALTIGLAAGATFAQDAPVPDTTGLLGALQRHASAAEPMPALLEVIRDLGRGVAASGKKVRLREMSLRAKASILRLGLEDALSAYDVKRAINAASSRVEADEGRVMPEKGGGVSVEFKLTPREGAASTPTADPEAADEVAGKDLGEHIQVTASRMQLVLDSFEKIGAKSPDPTREKVVYRLGLGTTPPRVVADFLAYLALSWPVLEVDEIAVQEAPQKEAPHKVGEDPPPGWRTTVLVSYSRPKAGPR